MHCRKCDYPLWNLTARQCPECGEPFLPSEYEFVPGSVRFCCPHCGQAYYGTDAQGHLEPRTFQCVQCERPIDMDATVLLPGEGLHETATRPDRMPWFERGERGTIKAWFATIGAAMMRPKSLMRAVPEQVSHGRAWSFMFLTNLLYLCGSQFLPALAVLAVFGVVRATAPGTPPMGGLIAVQVIVQLLGTVVALAILPALWVWLIHGLLAITGGTGADMRRTAHAVYYGSAANALAAVPCDCVSYGGSIWWVVSTTLMVQAAHRCHGGRAAFATITAAVPLIVARLALVLGVSLAPLGFAPGIWKSQVGLLSGQSDTTSVVKAVIAWAGEHEGKGPAHAAQLIAADQLVPGSFVTDPFADLAKFPVGDVDLKQLRTMAPNRLRLAVDAAADAMPPNTVAHRVGDFMFTYHGADLSQCDPGLWIVVLVPDPDVHGPPGPDDPVFIGTAGGSVQQTKAAAIPQQQLLQNQLRTRLGLPPLPDLTTVTHDTPAVAGEREKDTADQQ